jgi:hypothetical protein
MSDCFSSVGAGDESNNVDTVAHKPFLLPPTKLIQSLVPNGLFNDVS